MIYRIAAVAALGLLVSGCSEQGGPESSGSTVRGNGWSIDRKTSQLDGDITTASKRFESTGSKIDVHVSCAAGRPGISIESYADDGQAANPYISTMGPFGGQTPTGRAKASTSEVGRLGQLFSLNKYNNVISLMPVGLREGYLSRNGIKMNYGTWNDAALISESLPIVVEVNNSFGAHEIAIDASPEVAEVLHACRSYDLAYMPKALPPPEEPDQSYEEILAEANDRMEADKNYESSQSMSDVRALTSDELSVEPTEPAPPAEPLPPTRASIVQSFPPRYPPKAARAQIEGTVRLILTISASGELVNAEIGTSSRDKDLDEAALNGVRNWKFAPATENGQGVESQMAVPIDFNLG